MLQVNYRRKNRHQPDPGASQVFFRRLVIVFQVIQFAADAGKVPDPVPVAVAEGPDEELIKCPVLVPMRIRFRGTVPLQLTVQLLHGHVGRRVVLSYFFHTFLRNLIFLFGYFVGLLFLRENRIGLCSILNDGLLLLLPSASGQKEHRDHHDA